MKVAIVGAGVVGASIGWHLRKLGVRDVVLLERGAGPGAGSTGRATGGYRAQYGTEVNVRLSLLARGELLRFREETGVDPGYDPRGYLWLAQSEDELNILRQAQTVQHAAGLHEARLTSAAEIAVLNPSIRGSFAGGAYCPSDGFIKPLEILRGYLRGADVRYRAEVVGLEEGWRIGLAGGEVIEADHVVDAAGAWAASITRFAGIELPVTPLRRQVAATRETTVLGTQLPMTIWAGDGYHFRARDGRVLILLPTPGDPRDPYSLSIDGDWLEKIRALTRERVPALGEVPIDVEKSWAGLYEMSPDKHALLGQVRSGLWVANGSSGHGVMHAPALGLLLAEMILGLPPSMDARALRPERFAEGEPNAAPELL